MSDIRPNLTPNERLRCAYAHFILGIDQHHIAAVMATNQARVNEACRAIALAAADPLKFMKDEKECQPQQLSLEENLLPGLIQN